MYDEPAVIFFLTQGSIVYAEVIGHSNAFIPVLHCHSVLVYSHCLLVKVLELTQCVPGVKSRDPHVFLLVILPWNTSLTNLWRGKFYKDQYLSSHRHKARHFSLWRQMDEIDFMKPFCLIEDLIFWLTGWPMLGGCVLKSFSLHHHLCWSELISTPVKCSVSHHMVSISRNYRLSIFHGSWVFFPAFPLLFSVHLT